MRIIRADHLVLTVADVPATVGWYQQVLGMRHVTFADGRHALAFGQQKLNLHQAGRELEPKAARPLPGTADLCLISATTLSDVLAHLRACAVTVEQGPVARTGATGPITSLYVRDPDGNLIEIATYDAGRPQAPDPYDLLPAVPAFTLSSPDLHEDRPLGLRHVHPIAGGGGHSPTLTWHGAPTGTRGYTVTCYDPDAPTGSGFWHWVLINLPAGCTRLPFGAGSGDGTHLPTGAHHLRNDFGTPSYGGAAPPPGDPAHRYLFAVHALDADVLDLAPHASTGQAGLTLTRHTIARAVLRLTYQRA
jgi:Raf kinase inhibitor-like YbhB/YbcL family protein